MKTLAPLLACLLLLPLAAAQSERYLETVEVTPGGRLVVELDTGGSIRLRGWDRDAIEVSSARLPGNGRSVVVVEPSDRGVLVRSLAGATSGWSANHLLELKVPRRYDVELETRAGTVDVEGLEGEIWVESSGGGLRFADLNGRLDASTNGGDIEVSDSSVDGRVRTNGGVIRVSEVRGSIESATLGGDVIYRGQSSAPGAGPLRIETHGGDIRVDDAPEGLDASTQGGDIVVSSAAGEVSLKTEGGNIVVDALAGCIQARTMSGNVSIAVVDDPGTRCDIRLTSHSGSVTLAVPEDLAMDVDMRVSHARGREAQVVSDFELRVDREPRWDYSLGAPRKWIVARGRNGAGTHHVRIETFNGDARLERR